LLVTSIHRRRRPRTAAQLTAATGLHLDIVNRHARRDLRQRQRVPDGWFGVRPALHPRPSLEAVRSQNVSLLAVFVLQQGNAGGAIWIVLNKRHSGRDAILVPFEIDNPVLLLMPAAAMTDRNLPLIVPPTLFLQAHRERLLATLLAVGDLGE